MDLVEFYDYKNLLMKDLCCNPEVVKLVTGNPNPKVPNHQLAYTQIHPYQFLPETTSEAKTFICFDVDIREVPTKTYYMPVVYVWILTHKSNFRLPQGGLLLDKLSAVINEMLSGSRYFGMGELKLSSVERFVPIVDYQGRELVYTTMDWNRRPASKDVPGNRKAGR